MRHRTSTLALIAALALVVSACGDDDTGTTAPPTTTGTTTTAPAATTTTPAATTTTAAAATTTAAPAATTTTAAPMTAISSDGSDYSIDWGQVTPYFAPPVAGSDDPFYHLHSDPVVDGFFLSVEAYTVYGTAWTGELGTFEIDCSPAGTGICVHFDPDGDGPEGNAGADFLATGQITFHELGAGRFSATLENVAFSNGVTITGPLELGS